MKPLLGFITVAVLSVSALGQSLLNASRGIPQPNDGTTGTTLWGTASVNSAGNAITAAANATGPVRIVVGGAGTSGNAVLASTGTLAFCTMDSTLASAGNAYVIQGATAGQCHPQTAAPTAGTWVIGYVHDPATTSGSPALVHVNGFIYGSGAGGSLTYPLTVGGTVNSGGIPYFSSATQQSSSAVLTLNSLILGGGAGGAPITVPGITSDGVSTLNLGVSGTSTGGINFYNTTAGGSINVAAPTGALGTRTYTWALPATGNSATIPNVASANTWTAQQTFTNATTKQGQASLTTTSSPAAPVTISTPESLVVKSSSQMAAARIVANTVIRATWIGTCTSTAANASTFAIRYGTTGTSSDTLVASATTAVSATTGSSVPFRAVMEVTFNTGGSSGSGAGTLILYNGGGGTTGIATTVIQIINFSVSANVNPGASFDMTYVAGTNTTATFTQAFLEFVNQ